VALAPVVVVLAFMAVQAAMWNHARAEVRSIARSSAAFVARGHADVDDTVRSTTALLVSETDLADPVVQIEVDDDIVVCRISGDAPGMLRGTQVRLEVIDGVPLEGLLA
jgi:hypothetical protein